MKLGPKQRELLIALGPHSVLVLQDATVRRLVALGLCCEDGPDGAVCLSTVGLRWLADDIEAGRADDPLTRLRARKAQEAARG